MWSRFLDEQDGDVPGWVLVTAMSAGLVVALWLLAGNALEEMITNALDAVRAKLPG